MPSVWWEGGSGGDAEDEVTRHADGRRTRGGGT